MADEKITIKDMVDLKCRAVVEEEDLDIICGKEKISGKEQALQMEKNIMDTIAEKSKRRGRQTQVIPEEKKARPGTAATNAGIN